MLAWEGSTCPALNPLQSSRRRVGCPTLDSSEESDWQLSPVPGSSVSGLHDEELLFSSRVTSPNYVVRRLTLYVILNLGGLQI